MAPNAHPPTPGPFVQPNFAAVMEALGTVTFPISKRELLEMMGDGTVILDGRNMSLHDLIKDIHDDYFDSEAEFLSALEMEHATLAGGETSGEMPTGAQDSWHTRVGRGDVAGASSYLEPPPG
ncbi:MAG TPA: hypothetical protein VFH78_13025 [Candidatus Thermoplasmatota archaeon]|nr:hypothetical protein [Candidatus Thermoplasmatota archaeon]